MKIEEIQEKLSAPFSVHEISFRVGSTTGAKDKGMCLYYMDSRAVETRLDDVVGPDGWQNRFPYKGCCEIGIKINDEWLWKSNGAGETSFEAEKGQYSDAIKRAATMWGIGRYLYDGSSNWYEIEARGKSYAFTKPALIEIKKEYSAWVKRIEDAFRFKPGEKAEIIKQVHDALFNGDGDQLKEIFADYSDYEAKMKVWSLFTSGERSAIKTMLGT